METIIIFICTQYRHTQQNTLPLLHRNIAKWWWLQLVRHLDLKQFKHRTCKLSTKLNRLPTNTKRKHEINTRTKEPRRLAHSQNKKTYTQTHKTNPHMKWTQERNLKTTKLLRTLIQNTRTGKYNYKKTQTKHMRHTTTYTQNRQNHGEKTRAATEPNNVHHVVAERCGRTGTIASRSITQPTKNLRHRVSPEPRKHRRRRRRV